MQRFRPIRKRANRIAPLVNESWAAAFSWLGNHLVSAKLGGAYATKLKHFKVCPSGYFGTRYMDPVIQYPPSVFMRSLSFIASASVFLFGAFPVSAALTTNTGDLLMGFYRVETDPVSLIPAVIAKTYVYNLGPAATWRENTTTVVTLGNIKADLDEALGADWAESLDVRWGIVASTGISGTTISGDPLRTSYYSRALSVFDPRSSQGYTLSSANRTGTANAINDFVTAMHGKPSGANASGAIVDPSVTASFSSYLPPTLTTFFNVGVSPLTSFGVGTIGAATTYNVEAALDVYRMIHSTSGADLTAGLSPGNAVVGTAQYIGTFTIDSTGTLRHDATESTLPTDGYTGWADANSLIGPDRAADADPDKDGLANAVEFVVGGDPALPVDAAKIPTVQPGPSGGLEMIFRRTDASVYLNPAAEYDNDLVGGWTAAVNGTSGVSITISDNFYDATTDKITVTIPASGLRNFARLRVTVPQ